MRDLDPTFIRRPALDADAEGLIHLIGAIWAEYPGVILDVDGEVPELRAIATSFARLGGEFWVVEEGTRNPRGSTPLAGCVGWVPSPSLGHGLELRKLYVAKPHRRRGIGAYLCTLVEQAARRSSATAVELWSDTRFLDAHRLYERVGYVRDGRSRELHDLSATVEHHFVKDLTESPFTRG